MKSERTEIDNIFNQMKTSLDIILDKSVNKSNKEERRIEDRDMPVCGVLHAFNKRKMFFKDYDENAEIIAFFICDGCYGRRVYRLVKSVKKLGLDVIHFRSCMQMEDYQKCPHIDSIKKTIEDAGIRIFEGTYH